MARVPDHLLRDWIERLDDVANAPDLDPAMAEELGLMAGSLRDILGESLPTASDKRRGLGRGLESLIPTGTDTVEDIESLRDRLRRIAASARPLDVSEVEGVASPDVPVVHT